MIILYAEVADGSLEEFEVDDDQTEIFLEYCDIMSSLHSTALYQ